MIQLVYASHATAPFTVGALQDLLRRARAHNTEVDVSGMLLHVGGAFLQVLEGAAAAVDELYAHIARDRRHQRIVLLVRRELDERCFADWSMGFFDATGRAAGLPGYRAHSGFADLAGESAEVVRIVEQFRAGRWRSLTA
ncbi:MAG TPA: BLUF domain-containing protein [Kofleriaceae bacterium]|nr:BLUF domain-containing protein [Kofleriaceae bacterium]